MANRLNRVLMFQLKAAREADHPNLIPVVDEKNIRVWYFLVLNLPPPYLRGEYVFRLTAPTAFPKRPPELVFLTENGVYGLGGKICISIGEFHSQNWRPALGMIGFAREVVNGLLVPDRLGGGIRLRNDTFAKKAVLAAKSVAYNEENLSSIMKQFKAYIRDYPDAKAVTLRRLRLAADAFSAYDISKSSMEVLDERLRAAFTTDEWDAKVPALRHVLSIPDLPYSKLAEMGFLASGRTVLIRVKGCLIGTLTEWDLPIKAVLVLAMEVRLCAELTLGENRSQTWQNTAHPKAYYERYTQYLDAFDKFIKVLPGVCGRASLNTVPCAIAHLKPWPRAFAEIHRDLMSFLCEQDIDKKAQKGKTLRDAALKAAQLFDNVQPYDGKSLAKGKSPPEKGQAGTPLNMDNYVSSLLENL
jgi:ubiquitin-conjugating enzyme E2 J2